MRPVPAIVLTSLVLASAAGIAASSSPQQQRPGEQLIARGQITQVHAARLFTMQSDVAGEPEVLVIPPRPVSISLAGSNVEVRGVLRRMNSVELGAGWNDIDDQARRAFGGRRVLVASSLMAMAPAEPGAARGQTAGFGEMSATETEPASRGAVSNTTLHIMPTTLVDFINDFAGQRVAVTNARVVGVLAPGAFLIEPATRHQMMMDYRDRILVLVDAAQLTVSAEAIVSATVAVEGIARTLPDMRLTAGTAWPAKLTPDAIERLEVRAAIVASSVRTPDGSELTSRAVASR
jgi:hypothetical protein